MFKMFKKFKMFKDNFLKPQSCSERFNIASIRVSLLLSNSEMFDTLYLYIFYIMIVLVNLDMV